jgi:epoxide hydrolase-like predicted phosphatase
MSVKAVIFDLGGVLLRTTNFAPRDRLAINLNMSRHELEDLVFGGESGNKVQLGQITVQEHWANLERQLHYSPEELKALLDEFFEDDELDVAMLDYIRELHKRYKTALLSNAGNDLRQLIAEKWHFEDAFDKIIISAEVGMAKPDPGIFQLAVEKLGVKAEQAVFVDDMYRNVQGAKSIGLLGIHFQNPDQMRLDLEKLLNTH